MEHDKNDILCVAQDYALLQSWILALEDALETKKMQKTFLLFNDEFNSEITQRVGSLLRDFGIDVPDSESE